MDFWPFVVAFGLGLVASVASWWIVTALFAPKLEISTLNRKPEDRNLEPCGFRYRIKVRNLRRSYAAGDLTLHAKLVIPGLDGNPLSRTWLSIPIGHDVYPVLEGRKAGFELSERNFTLHIHDLERSARLTQRTVDALNNRTITLDELLALGSGGFILVAVQASHARSGHTRTYSVEFGPHDVREGVFAPGSVKIRIDAP
jgi:hypothetical protein